MKFKMIVSDFDNTLYSGEVGYVTENTIAAVNQYIENGGIFRIVTGRMFMAILPLARSMRLSGEIVCYNGAAVYDIATEELLFHLPIANEVAVELFRYCEQNGYVAQCYIDDTLFTEKPTRYTDFYIDYCKARVTYSGVKMSEYLQNTGKDVTKVLIYAKDGDLSRLYADTSALMGDRVIITKSSEFMLEYVSAQAGKDKGVQFLADKYGVKPQEILAFGDQSNDVCMLKYAGVAVTVRNALDDVKAVADFVTDTAKEEGVARFLRENVLNDEVK